MIIAIIHAATINKLAHAKGCAGQSRVMLNANMVQLTQAYAGNVNDRITDKQRAKNIRLCITRRQDASLDITQVFEQSQTGSCQSSLQHRCCEHTEKHNAMPTIQTALNTLKPPTTMRRLATAIMLTQYRQIT